MCGMPGIMPMQTDDRRGDDQHLRPGKQLADQLAADVLLGCPRGYDHAGGGGDDERGNLRHQAVADGQQRVVLSAVAKSRSCCSMPMIRPPTTLMNRIRMPAIASPRTNLLAPSIAP